MSGAAGGVVLALAAGAALVLSNSPWGGDYAALWSQTATVSIGDWFLLSKPTLLWVNDLWMALFFLLVGLEIKHELIEGELRTRSQALLPAVAALGGMAVPALIFSLINAGDATALRGWAIPAATDIAFAVGIVALLGSRVPVSLKIFLTAVAIIDDLGAIVVIAIFYTDQLSGAALASAAVCAALLLALNRARVMRPEVYMIVGLLMWVFVLKSGVHATLAGVLTALAVPLRRADGSSPAGQLRDLLHPWITFGILPVFAFANAGVSLAGMTPAALLQPLPLGIAVGLVAGKAIGVFGSVWLMVRAGFATRPAGASWLQVFGVCLLCGIGFTMSLFIGSLAYEGLDPSYDVRVKLGVLFGSTVAAVLGTLVLWRAAGAARLSGQLSSQRP
jgi:Na+:H+ antiporter, NhaA family